MIRYLEVVLSLGRTFAAKAWSGEPPYIGHWRRDYGYVDEERHACCLLRTVYCKTSVPRTLAMGQY